jgi:DNA-binding HxlR family transcriptional regulator
MTAKQKAGLLTLARRGSRVIGTKLLPVTTLAALERLGLVEAAGENRSPYTGVWQLTELGKTAVEKMAQQKGPTP